MANDNPHQLNISEVRDRFIRYCRDTVNYWSNFPDKTDKEKIEGAVFSVLVAIDGSAANLPAFLLAPLPDEDDKGYLQSIGENWYPENDKDSVRCDIAGDLHGLFMQGSDDDTLL